SLARVARGAGALVALLLVPYAALDLAPRLGALPSPVALPSWPALLAGAGAAYAAVLLLRASSEDALRRLMAIGALVLVPLGLFLPALAGPGLGLGVVVLALVVVGLAERSRVAAAASVALALVGLLIARPTVAFDQADADALRCLRAVPGSAWSSSRSPAHGSCLAPWTLGHRLAYLGRRAPTAPGNGQGRRRAAQALVATTEADLARAAGELRASHVLTGSLVAREWPAIEALVGPIAFAETAIGRLARQAPGPDSPWIEVLRIGEPADPVLVVLVSRASVSSQEGQPTMRAH
ncbi:MAG: hypothetical protein O2816_09615, partial [Planctomycetota bacterium]|nr:hypothetical protein [Planctomycetota bacterium]